MVTADGDGQRVVGRDKTRDLGDAPEILLGPKRRHQIEVAKIGELPTLEMFPARIQVDDAGIGNAAPKRYVVPAQRIRAESLPR